MRKLIIGDIHGCYDEFLNLVETANLSDDDEIIALGDVVDRGPNTQRVISFFDSHPNARTLMGNHEYKHILAWDGVIQADPAQQITRDQIPAERYPGFVETLRGYPLYLELPEALLIHGAFEPGMPVATQKKAVLLGTRNGEAHLRRRYAEPWYELYDGETPIVAGHRDYSGRGEVTMLKDRVYLLDTGCCYGKRLSALLLPDFRVLQVGSRKNYWGTIKQQFLAGKRAEGTPQASPQEMLRRIHQQKTIFREDHPRGLIEALGDVEPHARLAAVKALGQRGDNRWWALVRGDDDDIIRLGDSDLPAAVPALIYAMGWREWIFRTLAITKLGHIAAPEAVAQLGRALFHENQRIRSGAAEALGYRQEPPVVGMLLEALHHWDPDVVTEAVEALGGFRDPHILPALEALWERCPTGVDMNVVKTICRRLRHRFDSVPFSSRSVDPP